MGDCGKIQIRHSSPRNIRSSNPARQKQILGKPQKMNSSSPDSGQAATPAADQLISKTLLYQHFLAEREEILRHKWLESEKAGRDVGFEFALTNWVVHHRANWRKSRQCR
jgi:hypothetical protein